MARARRWSRWKATFLAALIADSGGCNSGGPAQDGGARTDGGRWCDAGCPPPPAQLAWDHAVLPTPHDQIDVCGAVVLPTGIAILAPPYIVLADKTDGHLIAQAPWPTWQNGIPSTCGPAVARGNGDLAVLMRDYPSSGDGLAVHEYAGSDLSAVKTTVVSKIFGEAVIGELGGEIYVLNHVGPSGVSTLYVYSLPDGGSVQTQVLATGNEAASLPAGSFAATPDGGLLTCGTFFKSGPPAVLRIDPPKTMTKTLSFSGGTGAVECRLIAGPDRDLVFWGLVRQPPHWDIVSSDGSKILAHTTGSDPGIFSG